MKRRIEEKIGGCTIRILPAGDIYRGVIIRGGKVTQPLEDTDPERLQARLRNEVGELHPNYFGMDGAVARFLSFFPEGFADPLFLAEERDYKLRSHDRLKATLPLDVAVNADADQAAQARHAFVTNLLSPFELARVSAVLRGPTGRDFVRGAARFALGEYGSGLAAMSRAVEPQGRISWPIATYLPNLWKPSEHMFLKPVATRDFAERIGHEFQYEYDSAMDPAVYLALLRLVSDTESGLAHLKPQDRIDVQSFIWVVGDYGEAEAEKLRQRREKS